MVVEGKAKNLPVIIHNIREVKL